VQKHSADNEIFDVVVVGGRLAGAATAMLLARRGIRVVVVDHSCSLTDTLSTHAFMRPGILQLQRWGLLDRVIAAGTPAAHVTTFTYADGRVPIEIEPRDGVDALYAPRRTVIDPILAHAATDAGAEIRIGHRVRGLIRSASGRVLGVTGVDSDNEPFSLKARFVVGADGIHSTIARLVEAPIEHRGRYATATTYGYWTGAAIDGFEWVFRPDASGGMAPTNDNQVVVFANATPARIRRGGIGVIESILRESAPELAERLTAARPPAGTRLFRAPPGFLRRAWGRGWALVGDAGYFKDPISAHGMTDALRDAELLARALISVQRGDAGEAAVLAEYQRTRDALSLPILTTVDSIASHRWSDAEIGDLLKRLAASMRIEAAFLAELDVDDWSNRGSRAA
jgi:2-polyprenyl-6-methoxyphenol hydroxylase-like FAD-dependent oxidoreductase